MEKVFNPNNLTDEEIEKFVTRVKILIINDSNQLLLCKIDGTYYFVGGHVEDQETLEKALKREVLEETGIDLKINDIQEPFLIYRYYNKNHYGTGIKCLSTINYCSVKTNIPFDLNHQKLDVNESKKNFVLEYIDLEEAPEILLNSASTPEQEALARKMIDVIHFFRIKPKILRKEFKGGCNE